MLYFLACVNETLRASPSTPVTLPRLVSDGELVLSSKFIPPETEIGANPYVINRDRMGFGTDADDFNPERWLEDPERTKQMHKWMFTWGWGPWDCVGRHFARMLAQKLFFQVYSVFLGSLKYISHSSLPCSFSEVFRLKGYQMKMDVVEATIEGCVSTKKDLESDHTSS